MAWQQHPTILAPIQNHPKILRTEVRPIFNRRAISDLLMPARCSLRISEACRAVLSGVGQSGAQPFPQNFSFELGIIGEYRHDLHQPSLLPHSNGDLVAKPIEVG
jgi:hypothetical protein